MKELRVVSVSLGSSSRDHVARARLLNRDFVLERRGVDGDLKKARDLIASLDGEVAAIGLGGIDLHLRAGGRKYLIRDAAKLAAAAKTTPVVDGGGLKDTLERETIRRLAQTSTVEFRGRRALVVAAVDRFGMAEELVRAGAKCSFGDVLFAAGIPIRLRTLRSVRSLAALVLPFATQLPFRLLYPTGSKQQDIYSTGSHARWMQNAEIIGGDFLLMRRYLPETLAGKTIITNTTTAADIELLHARNLQMLVTTTPEFGGRSFGTNVMEGVFAALGARTSQDYKSLLSQLDWQPRVVKF